MERSAKKYQLKMVGVRLVREKTFYSDTPISQPRHAVQIIQKFLDNFDKEAFGIICLSGCGTVNNISIVNIGTANMAITSPREAFKTAILSNATGVILFHNHPSGNVVPSQSDRELTCRCCKAGQILDIQVCDHIIVGGGCSDWYSFKEAQDPGLISWKDRDGEL